QIKAQAAATQVGTEIRPQEDTSAYIYDAISGAFNRLGAGNASGFSTEEQFAGNKDAGASNSLWSKASAIFRTILFPGLARHEETHINDARKAGLLKREEVTFGLRLRTYFTGKTPAELEGPAVWNAQRSNFQSFFLWSVPAIATLAVNHFGGNVSS